MAKGDPSERGQLVYCELLLKSLWSLVTSLEIGDKLTLVSLDTVAVAMLYSLCERERLLSRRLAPFLCPLV